MQKLVVSYSLLLVAPYQLSSLGQLDGNWLLENSNHELGSRPIRLFISSSSLVPINLSLKGSRAF